MLHLLKYLFAINANYTWNPFKLLRYKFYRKKSAILSAFILIFINNYIQFTFATVFSNSLHQCQEVCQERNLAFPLPHGSLGWPNISQSNCDFDCLLDACRLGCQDLDSHDSSCNSRCDPIGAGAAACNQGCRAVTDIFLNKIQGLLDLSSVESFHDSTLGLGMNWSFPEAQSNLLKEVSTTNIQWIAQSRPGGKQGWRWTKMDEKAFKDNSLISTVIVSLDSYYVDMELRLAANWRDNVIVSSKHFRQSTFPEKHLSQTYLPQPSSGSFLQLSPSSFGACWDTESPNKFKIKLFNVTKEGEMDQLIVSEIVADKCHVFRNLTVKEGGEFRLIIIDAGSLSENGDEEVKHPSPLNKRQPLEGRKDDDKALIYDNGLQLNISLIEIDEPKDPHPLLIFTDGSSLYLLHDVNDFVLLTEPIKVSFSLNDSQTISALSALSQTEVLIGLSDGAVFHLEILFESGMELELINRTMEGELKTQTRKIRESDGVAITQIVVDFIQERLYAIRDKLGILRCKINTCDNTTTNMLITNTPNYVQRIACDPWNGFIYYSTNVGDIFSMPLFSIDAPQNFSQTITRRIAEIPAANTVEVDISDQKLFVVTKSGHLMSRDLVDASIHDEREVWTLNDRYRNIIRSKFYQNRLFWISTSCGDSHPWERCLFSEEFEHQHKTIHLNKYLFAGSVREFTLLKPFPRLPFMFSPAKVGLIVVDMEAFISWKPPTFLSFQAIGSSWRSLTYEYILQSEEKDFTKINLDNPSEMDNSTEINENKNISLLTGTIPKIHATGTTQNTHSSTVHLENDIPSGNYYFAKVRVCTGNNNKICSAQITAKSQPIQLSQSNKQISLLNKRLSSSSADMITLHSSNINAYDWQGREFTEEQRLFYPQIPSEAGIAIAFDNTSNVLFSSSRKDASITQRFENNNFRFLESAFVHQITLIPSKALVLLATSYSVIVYRATSSFDKLSYNCAVGGEECGEVVGVVYDDGTSNQEGPRVLLLVQLSSGAVQLFQTTVDLNQPFQLVNSVPKGLPYRIRQVGGFIDGRFIILTEDGYFGTLDYDLTNINLNFAIREINHLMVADSVSPFERRFLHFDGPIHFDEKTAQLRWSVVRGGGELVSVTTATEDDLKSPQLIPLLYKLSLFRDGFSGKEPTLIVSQQNSFSLPPKLLQAWNSRQRFDAQVEAISPWLRVWANQTGLNAATKPPTTPEGVRIYATQQRTVDGSRAIIDIFWHEPSEWNGEKLGYQLNCTITQGTSSSIASSSQGAIQTSDPTNSNSSPTQYMNVTLKSSQRSSSFTVRSGKVGCLVYAINDQQLIGQPSALAEIDGSEFKPLIRLFAIDSTESLVAIQNWTIEVSKSGASIRKLRDLISAKNRRRQTTQIGQQQQQTSQQQQQQMLHSSQYQAITFVGNELYAIRKETEMLSSSSSSSQLFLVKLDINQVDQVIYKASLIGDFVQQQIDAMASDWVANRLLLVGNRALMQIELDQLQQDSATTISPKRLFQLSMGAQDAKQLIFDPFTNTALLLTKNGSLLALNLNNGSETNLELTTGCLKQKTITSIVGEFIWNRAASPQLYALTWNGLMELKLGADNCPEVNVNWEMFGERGLKAISLFAVADKVFVFATPTDLLVYDRLSASVSQFPIPNPPLRQLLTVSQSSQPFPDRNCFQLPPVSSIEFIVKNDGRTGAVVEVPEPKRDEKDEAVKQPIECQNISQPQTQYELHFRKRGAEKEKIIRTTNNKTFIEQGVLDKNTDYDVSLSWSNRFWTVQGQSELKLLHTGFGFPSAPREPTAFSLSPDTVLLSWLPPELLNAPASEIRYRISQQSSSIISPVPVAVRQGARGHFSTPTADVLSCDGSDICQAKVPNLRPSTDYHFWILALHVSRISLNSVEDPEATSVETQAHTRGIPGTLRLENATSTSLNLRWNTLPGAENGFPYVQHIQVSIQYRQSAVDASWTLLHNSTFILEPNTTLTSIGSQHSFCIEELRPATTYDYRYLAEYYNNIIPNEEASNKKEKVLITESFFQQVQQARTKAGTPSAPTNVHLINDPKGTWTLRWLAPESDGGETIQNYAVEYRPNSQSEWEIADRGLPSEKLFWRVTWSESHARHGSEPSDSELTDGQFRVRAANSEGFGDFGYTKVNGADSADSLERNGKGMLWNVLLILLLVLLLLCAGAYYTLRLKMSKRRKVREKLHKPICMESIGEQIQQFHQTQMQFSPEVQNELKILPKITPERVKITKQLGNGSFGRVCEGFMRIDRDVSVRVAVKYLKDNNAENRIKFLKEAILMNNFDHPNIVKLLGVNMEQGEHFLVLELMDGGDLLGFLRECRPRKGHPSRLCLRDLIAIAVDVGRGCVHLETYKHVHRDLAARNCLISSKTSPQRITKIADFGLARSLFVDDYYRVHGQDMLPLRWLSPEVITQGLFTSKSDVWAFGVLLWEIITLGEQPYSNRQNTEVLNLLSNGICLERPLECPEELYQVMRSCWTNPAEQRPRFLDIQPRMESIRGLTHFQSRDPFPSGHLNGFENSLDSSTSTHESSTTTNGGDSSNAVHFEKSENSSSRKHSRFGPKPTPRCQLGQQGTNGTTSTTTTNVALNDSYYELPIRPSTSSFQSSNNHNNHQNNQNSPFFASQFRKTSNSTIGQHQPPIVAFQNNAFMVDEGSTSSERLQKQPIWGTQINNNGINTARDLPTNEEQHRFGGSSRVSRV